LKAEKMLDPYVREEVAVAQTIERRLGRFNRLPEMVLVDRLYEQTGALGFTDLERGIIALEGRLLEHRELFLEVFTHELLEWRLRELGEEYSHAKAEALTPTILREAGLPTPGGSQGEWEPFLWGLVIGSLATIIAGGVALYFLWPHIARILGISKILEG
jgi:hypothetical protein